ncbi:MAG TPA: spore germination protein GerW family protein [Candidatus Limnocylindrales bacterium]|nr:spore germination protein GerW family protein [Candidatus Limnocylindrales bacterium]
MTSPSLDEARHAAQEAAAGPADRLLLRLADAVGSKATIGTVFGDPIRHGPVTVVPVARVRWGFGGGGGRSDAAATGPASGSGGGGGVAADPVGYLEIDEAGAVFRPIPSGRPSAGFVLMAGIAVGIVVRALARLGRR